MLCGKSTDETEPEPPISANRADPSCDSTGALDDPVAAAGSAADTCPFDCTGAPAPAPTSAPRACVSEVRTAASPPSSKVSTGCAGITGVVGSRSASAPSEPESATSSALFSSGVSVDLPINRLKKLNMVCSGGGGAFYRCRRNRVPASNAHKNANAKVTRDAGPRKAAGNSGKSRACAQKRRKTRILSAATDCSGRSGGEPLHRARRGCGNVPASANANSCKTTTFLPDPRDHPAASTHARPCPVPPLPAL